MPDPGSDGCPFCAIVAGTAPADLVLDDDVAVAFLDHRPLFPGHVLVVPRRHVVTLPELDPAEVGPLFERVRRVPGCPTVCPGAPRTVSGAAEGQRQPREQESSRPQEQ